MKTRIKMIFSAALAAAVFGTFSAPAAADAPKTNAVPAVANAVSTNAKPADVMTALFGDPVIAKGKGFEVKRSEVDEVISAIKARAAVVGRPIPAEQLAQFQLMALNELIGTQLLLQKATDADKADGKKKADAQLAAFMQQSGSQEAFDRELKASGMTADELRLKATQRYTAAAALMRELKVTATDLEATNYYKDHPADFEQPELVHVRHIFLMIMDPATREPLPADQQQAKRKEIDDILKRARAGDDFMALVKQYSEDPGSKDDSGEITLARGNSGTPPEIEAAAFSLTNNQISDVVITTYGYSIIKLLNKTPAKKVVFSTVADKIKDFLTRQKADQLTPAYLDKLKKDAGVEILNADLKAMAEAETAPATNAPSTPPGK